MHTCYTLKDRNVSFMFLVMTGRFSQHVSKKLIDVMGKRKKCDSWSASILRIIQTRESPTGFNIITADVIENVLRFKGGYLNKSHYQYAEAVFNITEKKRV